MSRNGQISPRLGTRSSQLALVQAETATEFLRAAFPRLAMTIVPFSSPGDRDKQLDLRESPSDFFTRDLDDAVAGGEIDAAVHSAKDLPEPVSDRLDWVWLPDPAPPQDVLIHRTGWDGDAPLCGVSSGRRAAYIQQRFPKAELKPIRGTIGERLAQLDDGKYDILVMAVCALTRLGILAEEAASGGRQTADGTRTYASIPLADLPVPAGQGYLAVTFRADDARFRRLRTAWLPPVQFVSAGCGGADQISVAGLRELRTCDMCLHDALLDDGLLRQLPKTAQAVYVGKRVNQHSMKQEQITRLICDYARQGKKVVRLKGGDAGIFGRLAEEVEALDARELPYRVHPGISALCAATTASGLHLTRRGVTNGFTVFSATSANEYQERSRTRVAFMGSRKISDVCAEAWVPGRPGSTPVCLVLAAGCEDEAFLFGTLSDPPELPAGQRPGLVLIGETAAEPYRYPAHGPLRGKRVWLTCSEAMQGRTAPLVRRFGGVPIRKPLIRLTPLAVTLPDLKTYDWVILTSPSSVDCLLAQMDDVRSLPKLMVCGKGTQTHLKTYRLVPDARPTYGFSTQGVLRTALEVIPRDASILRLRSDLAGPRLADALRESFARVDDVVLYQNEPVTYSQPPDCEVVFFASSSGVTSLVEQFGAAWLADKICLPLGQMDADAMRKHGIKPAFLPSQANAAQALQELANRLIQQEFLELR